jgi:imidazolonepropionase-like amidohydrolase
VTVIDVAAGLAQPNVTVVVQGERIVAVVPAASRLTPATALVDGSGKFLIPGLWDMHVHLIPVIEGVPGLGGKQDSKTDPAFLALLTRHGVTGVRHMFSFNPGYVYRPPANPRDEPVHPWVVAANQMLDGDPPVLAGFARSNVVVAKTAAEARAAVRELKKRGNHFVKVYSNLSKEAYLAALDEAKQLGIDVAGHVPRGVSAAEASAAGQRSIEHLDGVSVAGSSLEARLRAERLVVPLKPDAATGWRVQVEAIDSRDERKLGALIETFRTNQTWHVPTLVQTRAVGLLGDPKEPPPAHLADLPPAVKFVWRREFRPDGGVKVPLLGIELSRHDLCDRKRLLEGDRELVTRLHRGGVQLLAGTDTPAPLVVPGLSLHEELALLVEAGLTPAEALRTATLNPAQYLRREKDLGTVEVGKFADLVLLSANPLDDIKNTRRIVSVWIGGRKAYP